MSKPNFFEKIKVSKPSSANFDLTHDVKMSANMGNLTPILTMECLPGDKFKIGCESLIRFQPLIAPVMHRMDVTMHYFFVPNRLLWDNWEKFITNPQSGLVHPHYNYSNDYYSNDQKKFMDYMGIPPNSNGQPATINVLPFAAYQKIYNDYYRDQNLIPEVNFKLTDGDNSTNLELFKMRLRSWEHDYFTSCLPWAQKGQPVSIPLGEVKDDARVYGNSDLFNNLTGSSYNAKVPAGTPNTSMPPENLFAATSGLEMTPTTITDLRRAFKLQEWLEKQARGGTRYIEQILMHFGIKSSDARLQRPEYIGGVKTPVVVSEVLNTTGEDGGLPQGNMAGHGVAVQSGGYSDYFCEEHGYIIGIMSVMPKTAYMQGIPKHYLKNDALDYYWPSFANIGEQPVQNQELFAFTPNAEGTFGYVPRYAEYKFLPSRVAADMRDSLDYWHLGRKFQNAPALNESFIECKPEATKRIFAVTDPFQDSLIIHVLNKIHARRKMPYFGNPMM